MIVPARNERPTTDPCHPVARSQPGRLINTTKRTTGIIEISTSDVAKVLLTAAR